MRNNNIRNEIKESVSRLFLCQKDQKPAGKHIAGLESASCERQILRVCTMKLTNLRDLLFLRDCFFCRKGIRLTIGEILFFHNGPLKEAVDPLFR